VPDDVLKATLLDILYELKESYFALPIGGGYGLFLKQLHLAPSGQTRTLFAPESRPHRLESEDEYTGSLEQVSKVIRRHAANLHLDYIEFFERCSCATSTAMATFVGAANRGDAEEIAPTVVRGARDDPGSRGNQESRRLLLGGKDSIGQLFSSSLSDYVPLLRAPRLFCNSHPEPTGIQEGV